MEEPPLRGVPPPSVSQCLALVLCDVIDAFCRGEVIQLFSCKLRAGSAMSHVISRGPIELLDVGFMRIVASATMHFIGSDDCQAEC